MSQKTRRIFFDLDFTLYDTAALMENLRNDLERLGYSRCAIDAGFDQLNDAGYSLEGHLRLLGHPEGKVQERANELRFHLSYGTKYLLPGVHDLLCKLRDNSELHLLTFGYPPYQQAKFAGLEGLASVFADAHYVWNDGSKGEVIARFDPEDESWFLDDSLSHLEDVCQKAPWAKVIRVAWPQFKPRLFPGDHIRWDVASSAEDIAKLLGR
ncbi:hypothetical protein HZC53_01150 [Candidatus Uhrbacteria bacterium]|nr:hypothetical protein [Candidatus Uhrbacteria bacterium]